MEIKMYKLFELCKWNARHIIDEGCKDTLFNQDAVIKILAESLKDLDKLNGIRPFSKIEYSEMASQHKELNFIGNQIYFLSKTYKNIKTDKGISEVEKIDILRKSVVLFEDLFEDLCQQDTYLNNEDLSNAHAQIIIDLKNKFKIKGDGTKILNLLEASNCNFLLIFDNNTKVYPVIVDLLYDTFTLEYNCSIKNKNVDFLKSKEQFPLTQKEYEEEGAYSSKYYAKIEFRHQVHTKKVRQYILHEFARALKCDIKKLKKLYKELLYYNPDVHPNALKAPIDISKIAPRQFLMPTVKMIKPIEYTGIKHAYSNI
jgi:hypothetical protein